MKTIDLLPTPAGCRVLFKRTGIGACPRCGDYGPHKEVETGKARNDEERRCRKCRKVFYMNEVPYIKAALDAGL